MTEFYEGQAVYVQPTNSRNTWVRGVVQRNVLQWLVIDGLVAVDIRPEGEAHILLARPGELVKGDAG